ncbi:U3 small nucleolar RNA-associated protein 15 homolog [Agrilus planipennis]|uniref:U3 small nucleolar RNA-associated protein 15 homolog n=1 Tax=Agrilus planipennis TaxID=224129 RepID=A0A1W4X7X8_AGRPL|nr:U3 small nucleolar RNA-associated protein 15 homolog [Agrilus planipennis]
MSNFKRLNTKIYKKSGPTVTPDSIYWKKLKPPVLVKEFGPIDYIDFSPVEPYYFAVTCSVRVQIYNPITKVVAKNLSRFREAAYGAVFKSDGRLLLTGSEEKNVKLFDVSTKSLLRLFKGHTAAVHRVNFLPGQLQIASYSDDKTVKVWDIPTEKNLITYEEHTDYIRAGVVNPTVENTFISGGYDGQIKMFDIRTEKPIFSVSHGSPVEALLFVPTGGAFLSAGGTDIKIWDPLMGGKLRGSISQHHKTITCLRMATDNKRLLSGSLDRHVKVYDINTYEVVHTMDYSNAILSLDISKNDDTLTVGLVDGLVCVSRREEDIQEKPVQKKKRASYRYTSYINFYDADLVVEPEIKEKEAKYDKSLRKFMFSKALDQTLIPYVANKTPEVAVTLMQELMRRKVLEKAFAGRTPKSILSILKFIHKNIVNYRFTRVLIDAFNVFLNVYENSLDEMPANVCTILIEINKLLAEELNLLNQLAELQGSMSMLLAAATSASDVDVLKDKSTLSLVPSENARKNFVVNIS